MSFSNLLPFFTVFAVSRAISYNYNESTPLAPSKWGSLYWQECGRNRQSPINVVTTDNLTYFENEAACEEDGYFLDFDLDHDRFRVENTGKSFFITPIDANGNPLTTNETAIGRITNVLPGGSQAEYCFDSLHFHWGPDNTQGSEHFLDGVQYPIEGHFVFFSCSYQNIVAAVQAHLASATRETEVLAVIGVFYEVDDDDNPSFTPIVDNVNDILSFGDVTTLTLDFSGFLGDEDDIDEFIEDVYIYKGSLTTPRCLRAVLWHVSDNILTISQSQLNALYTIQYDGDSNFATYSQFGNFRPVQPRLNRNIWKLDCDDDQGEDDDDQGEDEQD